MDADAFKTLNVNIQDMEMELCSSAVECTGVQLCLLPNSCTGGNLFFLGCVFYITHTLVTLCVSVSVSVSVSVTVSVSVSVSVSAHMRPHTHDSLW
jgi:hypothetical protein